MNFVQTPATAFNEAIDAWQAQQTTPWMRIKHVTTRANLQKHIVLDAAKAHPLKILDIGGGTGIESIPLAQQGHSVDLVDYSSEMLAVANDTIGKLGLQANVHLHHANLRNIPQLFESEQFDLVLCHNVIQYVGDLNAALAAITHALKVGGTCSLISQNRYSLALRDALFEDDLSKALESLDQHTEMTRVFGHEVPVYTADEIIALIPNHQCALLGHYGIWCVTMYWGDNERKSDPLLYQQLEQLELAMTGRHPYNLIGRYYQLICKKTA